MATYAMGNSSSPGSSSPASSTSSCNDGCISPIRSPDTTTEDISGGPYLQILEEPYDKFRFRYKTEMQGTHGAILGANGQRNKSKKTFPKVKLCNYTPSKGRKDPIIRCTLYTAEGDEDKRVAHVHRLIGKDNGMAQDDPHDIVVHGPSYTAIFKNMTILFTKKEEQEKVLIEKKQSHMKRRFTDNRQVKLISWDQLRLQILEEHLNMNLNVACLRFEALVDNGQGMYTSLCRPVYSNPINNMKNPQTNELRICRTDKCTGSCLGKEEVVIFVEKVVKKNIKVKFYEEGPNKEIVWSDYAIFTQDDVHHQYGIAFRTPPYRDPNITNGVSVFYQLERPSDNAVSDPFTFEYLPDIHRRRDMNRKRPRQDSTLTLPTVLNDFPVKAVPRNMETTDWPDLSMVNDFNLSNTMDDTNDLLRDLGLCAFQNNPELQGEATEGISSLTSSTLSFNKMLDNLPSADSEAVSQFLSSGRLQDYAMINGEEEGAELLMSGTDIVFDGFCKLPVQSTFTKEAETAQVPKFSWSSSSDLNTVEHQRQLDNNPRRIPYFQMDNGDSESPRDMSRTSSRIWLNESNIVDKTEKALNGLLKLKQTKRISVMKSFRLYLTRLFSYTVEESEDSVFHVLAANCQIPVPVQAARFVNMLKIFDVIDTVINSENCKQETPLLVAARRGSPEMVSLLLEAGANVNSTDLRHNTAMHLAVLRDTGSMDVVAALLARHPDLTIHNEDGYTVFHLAVYRRKSDVISSLLVKSEDNVYTEDLVNRPDRKQGNTALHIAVENRFKEVVNLLLNFEERIEVDATNFDGKTPLACVLGETDLDSKEIADQLLSNKADPSLVDSYKRAKKEDYKNESETEPELQIVDTELDESESAYAREWDDNELLDKITVSKLCPLLDKNDEWELLFKKLKYTNSEIDYCKIHWSPTLFALKIAELNKPEITAEVVRDGLLKLAPHLRCGAQYIDDMFLQKLGLD